MFLGSSLALGPVGSSPESRVIKDLFNRAGVAIAGRDGTLVQSGGTGSTALHPTTAAVAASGDLISHNLTLAGAGVLPMSFAQGARTNLASAATNSTQLASNTLSGLARTIVENTATALREAYSANITLTNGVGYVLRGIVSRASGDRHASLVVERTGQAAGVVINLDTGALTNVINGGGSVASASAVALGGGRWLVTLTIASSAWGGTPQMHLGLTNSPTTRATYLGDGSSGVVYEAVTLEAATFSGLGLAEGATRAADNILWTPPSALSTTSGEVVAVTAPYLWSAGAGANGPMAAATIWCNRASNFAMYRDTTELVSRQDSAGSRTVSAAALSESSGVLKSRSVKWGADVRGYHDATSYGTPVAIVTPPWLSTTDLRVGRSYGSDTLHAYGFVGLIYIPNGLTDAERSALARLTIGTLNYVG